MTKRKNPGPPFRPTRLPEAYLKTGVNLLQSQIRWLGNRNRSAVLRALVAAEMAREGIVSPSIGISLFQVLINATQYSSGSHAGTVPRVSPVDGMTPAQVDRAPTGKVKSNGKGRTEKA